MFMLKMESNFIICCGICLSLIINMTITNEGIKTIYILYVLMHTITSVFALAERELPNYKLCSQCEERERVCRVKPHMSRYCGRCRHIEYESYGALTSLAYIPLVFSSVPAVILFSIWITNNIIVPGFWMIATPITTLAYFVIGIFPFAVCILNIPLMAFFIAYIYCALVQ